MQRSVPYLTGNFILGVFESRKILIISFLISHFEISEQYLQQLPLFRVLTELVNKMRDMQMDKTELGCLRAIVLFNPGA